MSKPIEIWPENVERVHKFIDGLDWTIRSKNTLHKLVNTLTAPKPEVRKAWPVGTKFRVDGHKCLLSIVGNSLANLIFIEGPDIGERYTNQWFYADYEAIPLPDDFLALNPQVVED